MAEVAKLLEQAHAAALAGRLDDALEPLREAWAQTRDRDLAELIEHVDASFVPDHELHGRSKGERDRAWHQLLERRGAAALGVLLAQLHDRTSTVMAERVRALLRVGPDPRSARAMLGLLASPPFSSSRVAIRRFWDDVRELLCASVDPRLVEPLEQVLADHRHAQLDSRHVARVDEFLAAFRAASEGWPIALDDAAQARLDALIGAHLRPGATQRSLLEAIWAAPDDDAPRQVYADYLLELGDPRGEFIALQLADARQDLDASGQARVRALWQAHGRAWLGALAADGVCESVEFRRGFLARVRFSAGPDLRRIDPATLRTIEVLERAPVGLLREHELHGVRELLCTEHELVALLRDGARVLDHVVRLRVELTRFGRELQRLLERPDALASLRELSVVGRAHQSIQAGRIDWMWTGPLGTRVERIELELGLDTRVLRTIVDELRARLCAARDPRLRNKLLARRAGLRSLVLDTSGNRWTLARDDADGPWATLHLQPSGPSAVVINNALKGELAVLAGTELRLRWDLAYVDLVDDATLTRLHELGAPTPESARGSGSRAPSSGE